MQSPTAGLLEFEDFALNLERAELLRHGKKIELRPKSFDLLRMLAENPNRVITKNELVNTVWQGRVATDESIARCISDVRQALGDGEQRLVETIPRRGYVFKPQPRPVEIVPPHNSPAPAEVLTPPAVQAPALALQPAELPARPSIMVLPFANLSDEKRLDYFADGFAEDITTGLTRYSQLFVIGRESAITFRSAAADAQSINRAIGVQYLVHGSLRQHGDQMRIAAQLQEGSSGKVLWADRFDRPAGDIFSLQDEIIGSIVATLVDTVDRETFVKSHRKPPATLDAYELFLRGRELRRSAVPANFGQAEALLERALALDPDFAAAHAEIAHVQHVCLGTQIGSSQRSARIEKGLRHARQAYALAPSMPFASQVLGNLHIRAHDFAEAERWARNAIKLGPGEAETYAGLANVLSFNGRSPEAIELMMTANRHNPIRPPFHEFYLARAYAFTGQYEKALPHAQSCLERAAEFWPCLLVLVMALAHTGHIAEARAALTRLQQVRDIATIGDFLRTTDYQPSTERDRIITGLRLAGLPE